MGDHLLGHGRVVGGKIPGLLEGDQTRLLGGKEALRRLGGQLRLGPERLLRFYDGPHRARSDECSRSRITVAVRSVGQPVQSAWTARGVFCSVVRRRTTP